ncbi:MAG: transcription antitermination factor NusB [Betaproteobacteria bacterium]|nr:transcription antitermination factor NusB [Betaproteobacteria bacterium]
MISPLTRAAMALKPAQLREARRFAVQLVYQLEAAQQTFLSDTILSTFLVQNEVLPELYDFIRIISECVVQEQQQIDALIEKSALNWKLSRIAKVDLAILRICTAELLTRTEIPKDVIIFEGVELGKQFGSTASGGFINGVLDALARTIASRNNTP